MTTVHLVYPTDPRRVAAPWSIGNHLRAALEAAGYAVTTYDWDHQGYVAAPVPGDILLGHPHPSHARAFHALLDFDGWSRVVGISPWNGSDEYTENIEDVRARCATYFAICGPYWARRFPARWRNVAALDMAIDADDFQPIKRGWNPPGCRRFLFVGCTLPCKGPQYLEAIAAAMPDTECGHIGPGALAGWTNYGYVPDTRGPHVRGLIGQYDFLLAVGPYDANPTTVLEAQAWGLIPLVAPTCGWTHTWQVPRDDLDACVARLREYQQMPAAQLDMERKRGFEAVRGFGFDLFVSRVLAALK